MDNVDKLLDTLNIADEKKPGEVAGPEVATAGPSSAEEQVPPLTPIPQASTSEEEEDDSTFFEDSTPQEVKSKVVAVPEKQPQAAKVEDKAEGAAKPAWKKPPYKKYAKRRGLRPVSTTGVRDPADIVPKTKRYSRKNMLQRRMYIPFVYTPMPSPRSSPEISPDSSPACSPVHKTPAAIPDDDDDAAGGAGATALSPADDEAST